VFSPYTNHQILPQENHPYPIEHIYELRLILKKKSLHIILQLLFIMKRQSVLHKLEMNF
jgi:hypothetical protein